MTEHSAAAAETVAAMINLDRYPILDLNSGAGASFAKRCRQQYLDTGLCMLPEFVSPAALETLAAEAGAITGGYVETGYVVVKSFHLPAPSYQLQASGFQLLFLRQRIQHLTGSGAGGQRFAF